MQNLFSFGLNILADVFYPKYCFGCQKPGRYLCKFCLSQIPKLASQYCIVCNKPSLRGLTHPTCKTPRTPDRLLCAFNYKNPVISEMIITGKYFFVSEVFAILGALTAEELFLQNRENLSGFVVCPLPLHKQRQRWRGFNQAAVAGKIIAQGLQLPYYPILQRVKNTKTQKDLNAQERQVNIKNAFQCTMDKERIPQKILLIDDVCTTGQTLLEATRALKRAGAATVWCLSIAKD